MRITFFALLACVAFALVLNQLVAVLPPESDSDPFLGAWLRLWIFGAIFLCALALAKLPNQFLQETTLASILGICFAGIVFLGLRSTPFGLNGVSGDAGLMTAQVTKFSLNWAFPDFAYKDLSPFYPPLYFLVLGKIAGVLSIEPYQLLKLGLVATALLLPLAVQSAWSFTGRRTVTLAALGSLFLYQDWYKPYEWLSLALFIPWWIYAMDGHGVRHKKGSWLVWAGFLGALLFTTYYYWFFIGLVAFFASLVAERAQSVKLSATEKYRPILLWAIVGVFSIPYWGPLLWSLVQTGAASSLQNLYFLPDFSVLTFPFLEPSVSGILYLGGFVFLVWSAPRDKIARSLLLLLVAAYLWQIVGYIALLLHTPLLTFKSRDLITYVLGFAAVLAMAEHLPRVMKNRRWKGPALAGLIAVSLFFGQRIAVGFSDNELLEQAQRTEYPSDMLREYKSAMAGDIIDHVILATSNASELSVYLPTYQFLPWAAVYSHPAGEYYERLEFLKELSDISDPDWFAAALMNNRYSPIDEVVLFPKDEGFVFSYLSVGFPEGNKPGELLFSPELFDERYFNVANVGPYKMFIPIYAYNPLRNMSSLDANAEPPAGFNSADEFHAFIEQFGQHMSID